MRCREFGDRRVCRCVRDEAPRAYVHALGRLVSPALASLFAEEVPARFNTDPEYPVYYDFDPATGRFAVSADQRPLGARVERGGSGAEG